MRQLHRPTKDQSMDARVKDVMLECTKASDEERVTFAEVVKKLMGARVERYHTDLVRAEKIYYLPSGESELTPCEAIGIEAASKFSASDVEAAVKAIQAGKIEYKAFCRRVLEAGCVGYIVSMIGKRVVYYGRTGDSHVEWFPGAK
jgi:uncharacterized protein YbcV (DUF1398 family)